MKKQIHCSLDEYIKDIKNTPKEVYAIEIEGNLLRFGLNGVKQIFSSIPEHIETLICLNHQLNNLSAKELAEAFSALPDNITIVGFNIENFHLLDSDKGYIIHMLHEKNISLKSAHELSFDLSLSPSLLFLDKNPIEKEIVEEKSCTIL
ncbi:MAG: hypothetical protein EP298_02875 [Gammaproteobacteria bacterium]|nr:MAG: hypothetical protein EP298_02875 [Gammaproteobacteria bacterium]UTW43373.1 hypothetical protein KFE69_04560 [bacterium SCSIO 12844]